MPTDLVIRRAQTDAEILATFDVMAELRPHLARDQYVARVREQAAHGFELAAGTIDGRLLVVAGYRLTTNLVRGPHLFVDDLVTAAAEQGRGHGREIIAWLAAEARARGLARIYLDSRLAAKGFYERVGFTMHTSIPCWIDV
ncbi:MAG: GNAT family N-acetyltransferase [Phycisphaerae bacterium]|nr:GNAT family N-acetyltransferase [Tepidisphaeraceae bacterium]